MNLGHIKNIHFVGIGGIGMSGIAEILKSHDLVISGCDLKPSSVTERLEKRGIPVAIGHSGDHLGAADLLVISSAVKSNNAEVLAARAGHVPVIRRAEMLGEIMRLKKSVAIAGTHGKTTTSAMTAAVLASLDPTLIVGGVMRDIATNAQLGKGDLLVVEADEYDRSFLVLFPTIAAITNIEADHLDCYADLDDIKRAFLEFASRVPFYGLVIGCGDDQNVAALLDEVSKPVMSYGLSASADLRASEIRFTESGSDFLVTLQGNALGRVTLGVPGEHNVRNALAAIGVALEVGLPFSEASRALAAFHGVERRFQILGEHAGATIVDDYAHHPTEIRATLEAARRSYPDRRIIALFQPHLFSRTRDFFGDFADAFQSADVAFVSPIYAAREEPLEGVSTRMITDAAARKGRSNVKLLDLHNDEIVRHLDGFLTKGDVLITMGAGDINKVGLALVGRAA
ncbi:MAG TPA: UDP-N-acetylmuramate--L-alanine ligase [Thermoanaerobaculia bacterium]|nr:UDP-N-acetylmuramate--L-alanine ligase [Thermoanaerobaculia bacterium]